MAFGASAPEDGCLCALMIGKKCRCLQKASGAFACCFLIMRGIKGVGVCIGGFSSPVFESVVTNAFVGVFYLHVFVAQTVENYKSVYSK